MAFIRSISGVRATLGDALTPALVADYVSAFCTYLPDGAIVLGRDGRPSGTWIEHAAVAAIQACGREARILGMVPTPTVQIFAEETGTAGAISISASHNPAEYNGLKFLGGDGLFLRAGQLQEMWRLVDGGRFNYVCAGGEGSLIRVTKPLDTHIKRILDHPLFSADGGARLQAIRDRKFKVVVDAVNAAGSTAVPQLLEAMGCDVVRLYCNGSGVFPHTPEPLPQHLGDLSRAVREHNADLGIAVDPDADRLVIIDDHGNAIGEENTIVLATHAVMSAAEHFSTDEFDARTAVVNFSTTRGVEDAAAAHGGTVHRSAVGEINVVDKMLSTRAAVGGEGSGGVIVPQIHAGRDSLVGTALLLDFLVSRREKLSEVVASFPAYAMIKQKVAFEGDPSNLFDKLEATFSGARALHGDGIRLDFADAWVHVRASNTEPILRIISEAGDRKRAENMVKDVEDLMSTLVKMDS